MNNLQPTGRILQQRQGCRPRRGRAEDLAELGGEAAWPWKKDRDVSSPYHKHLYLLYGFHGRERCLSHFHF